MSSSNASFGIEITASDKTEKGARSVEKRMGRLPQSATKATERSFGQLDKVAARSGRNILSTFSRIERASAGVIGGSGGGSGIVGRLSALSSAGETAAGSLGEAAAAGGLLEATLGTVAVGGALVVGVLAGVAFATDKIASGWAKNVVGASNYASAIGVATKSLQAFQAAGERAGVDKSTSAGVLGGLSETLNDARYGKNPNAAGTLSYLGVKMKLNGDGTVDTTAMLPAIQAALRKQTSFGARQVAGNLGIGQAGLAIFRSGGDLPAEMADAERHANVVGVGDEAKAKRYNYQRTRLGQLAERASGRLGSGAAGVAQGVLDSAVDAGNSIADDGGASIVRGAEQFSAAVIDDFRPAVRELGKLIEGWQGGGRFSGAKVDRMAHASLPLYRQFLAHGDTPAAAAAWAAAAMAESSGDPHKQQPGRGRNLGYGLFQLDANRRALFKKVMGHEIYGSGFEEQATFRDYELAHKEARARRRIDAAPDAGGKGVAITRYFERPKYQDRDAADRANLASGIAQAIDVHHHVTVTVADQRGRTQATVHSQRGDGTPVHYAMGRPAS